MWTINYSLASIEIAFFVEHIVSKSAIQEAESITGKSILHSQISLTTEEKGDLASL